ncbi:MAG: hypothetical protein ACRD3D_17080 [Terriglobia bacterium]
MSQQTRKQWVETAAKVILIVAVCDVLLYLGSRRYVGNLVATEQDRFNAARLDWWREKQNLALLQKRTGSIPAAENAMRAFLDQHVPVQRQAYSRAASLVEQLSQKSQVQLVAIRYHPPAESKGEPLAHLTLETNVEGSFDNLLTFAHALETSNDFIVVRSFKFAAENQGVLGLHVNADLYLMPGRSAAP